MPWEQVHEVITGPWFMRLVHVVADKDPHPPTCELVERLGDGGEAELGAVAEWHRHDGEALADGLDNEPERQCVRDARGPLRDGVARRGCDDHRIGGWEFV
jgi:hypothetical protein